jgi:L-seryl-tRNA(Ser) seleniumtransferase
MLSMDTEQILNRSLSAVEKIREITGTGLEIDIVQGESVIGGGSAPDVKPITWCITLSSAKKTADELENILRNFDTPVVTRIVDGKVVIDMRTVFEDEEVKLIAAVSSLVK